jgi:hypothetical protein
MELDPICDPKYLYDEGGYDLSIIHEALAMTPLERLAALDEMMNFLEHVWELNGTGPVPHSAADPR